MTPRFPDSSEIKRSNDLAEIASRYAQLEPAGTGRMKACCPFHDERTPSFYVYADQHFKCYGCGKSGDVFELIQAMENVDFIGAKKLLSSHLPEVKPRSSFRGMPRESERRDWRLELAKSGVTEIEGSPGWNYLLKRGLTEKTIDAGRVKFARNWMRRASVLFPIYGADGQVVALQGRAIGASSAKITVGPKERGVFATWGAFQSDVVAVCEGPMDALSFLQIFEVPAIAICGSSAIPEWFLERFEGELLLASDNDPPNRQGQMPGEIAAQNWQKQADKSGILCRRVKPNSKDWNEELKP